ncbi:MAG TPA: TadE/TadG family type IV pilus assembly protein [Nocardioides sp.]|nr:TadE/TadG family type IV pilus assembly protein [Nocardioides sp.]
MTGHAARPSEPRGQSLVEFSLVLPIFLLIIIGLIEFALAFHGLLSINFASRDAALFAAEMSSDSGSDCVILRSIEEDVDVPAREAGIDEVRVYWATDTGGVMPGNPVNVYHRVGSTTCSLPDGATVTVPYTLVGAAGYPEDQRCDVLGGCGGAHDSVDTIGVRITYTHAWVTPLASILSFGGDGFQFVHSTAMRMEPSL